MRFTCTRMHLLLLLFLGLFLYLQQTYIGQKYHISIMFCIAQIFSSTPLMPIAGVWCEDNISTSFSNTNASHGDLAIRCFYTINKFLQSNKKLSLHIHAPPRVLPGYFLFRFFICLSMLVYVTFQGHKKGKKNWQIMQYGSRHANTHKDTWKYFRKGQNLFCNSNSML